MARFWGVVGMIEHWKGVGEVADGGASGRDGPEGRKRGIWLLKYLMDLSSLLSKLRKVLESVLPFPSSLRHSCTTLPHSHERDCHNHTSPPTPQAIYKNKAPTAPSTIATTPRDPAPTAAAPVNCDGDGLAAPDAAAPLEVEASEEPEVCAGAVVGSATPDGQCQWSPCGSQVAAVTAWEWSS